MATGCIKGFFTFQGRLAFCSCCWCAIFLNLAFDAGLGFVMLAAAHIKPSINFQGFMERSVLATGTRYFSIWHSMPGRGLLWLLIPEAVRFDI